MKKSTLVHTIFISLIALTILGATIFLIIDFHKSLESSHPDDMKWWGLGASIFLIIVGLVVLYELEVYRCVRYFVLCIKKHIAITILNILSILLVPLLAAAGWIIALHTDPPSLSLMELPVFVIPAQFLIVRLIGLQWFIEEENTDA